MQKIFEKLGIDYRLIFAQIVNFIAILIILKYFAYKPILRMLDDRSNRIKKSLEQAKRIEKELKDTENIKASEIKKAKEEAKEIIKEAYEISEKKSSESIEKTKRKIKDIVNKARAEIRFEKEKSVKEAKKEIAEISIAVAEKIIKKNIDKEVQKTFVEETLSKMKNL